MTTIDTTVLHWVLLSAAAAALLFGAAHDVAVRTVPNLVSAIVAVAGLGLNALDAHLGSAVFCGGLVFAGCWCCWRQGWIGGGDVKLLSACAMLVPPAAVPELVLATAIAGGALALFYLGLARLLPRGATTQSIGRRPTGLIGRIWRAERRRISRRLSLPYACAISAGVLLTLNISVALG
jgi:prepilin peptidase CpaA